MLSWQPIETAPKDGSFVLLTNGYRRQSHPGGWVSIGYWTHDLRGDGAGFYHAAGIAKLTPTYWMPLPEPPETQP